MEHLDPMTIMAKETRRLDGKIPTALDGCEITPEHYIMTENEFLMRAAGGTGFHYRRGEGVTVECPDDTAHQEADLWFNGSVYSAVAAMNGLIPLHASAVALQGSVFAITGPSGAGKSTLAAALSDDDVSLFCDDTALIDMSSDVPHCLPGHKRLKLDQKAGELAGATLHDRVSPSIQKHYAEVAQSATSTSLRLDTLIVLREDKAITIEELSAGDAIAALLADHYTVDFGQQAAKGGREEYWQTITKIVSQLRCVRFARPMDSSQFAASLSAIRSFVKGGPSQ